MTTPRSSAASATAGVGSTPPSTASPPAETTPRANACLELGARAARVAPDEDASRAAPERRRAAEPLDEVGREELADDAADAVGPEVAPRHRGRSLETDVRAPRVRPPPLPCESGTSGSPGQLRSAAQSKRGERSF